MLADFQLGGASKFNIGKDGTARVTGQLIAASVTGGTGLFTSITAANYIGLPSTGVSTLAASPTGTPLSGAIALTGQGTVRIWHDSATNRIIVSGQTGAGGGVTDLDSLTDVLLTTPATGQVLAYNGTLWVNSALLTGNISNLPLAIKDTVGNSGFFNFYSGVTGRWDQTSRTLSLSGINATTTTPGVASFDSANFSINNGRVSVSTIPFTAFPTPTYNTSFGMIGWDGVNYHSGVDLATTSGLALVLGTSTNPMRYIISGQRATATNIGLASFNPTYFSVASGAVSITGGLGTGQIVGLDEAIQDVVGATLQSVSGVSGIYIDASNLFYISGIPATTTTVGVASFNATNFAVNGGAVTITGLSTGLTGNFNQLNLSNGFFATPGDAEVSRYIMRCSTTNKTPTEFFMNGSTTRALIPASSRWHVDIRVVASTDDANQTWASFHRKVMIARKTLASTTALVGSDQVIGSDIGSDNGSPPADWSIQISADITNGALKIEAIGDTTFPVRWVAEINTVEITYP